MHNSLLLFDTAPTAVWCVLMIYNRHLHTYHHGVVISSSAAVSIHLGTVASASQPMKPIKPMLKRSIITHDTTAPGQHQHPDNMKFHPVAPT